MADENFVKIAFELQQDEDGYPPDKYETLWAVALEQDGLYRLDNIPLYVKGVSSEDVVLAEWKEDRLEFVRLVEPSTNSVYRVFVGDLLDVQSASVLSQIFVNKGVRVSEGWSLLLRSMRRGDSCDCSAGRSGRFWR